MVNRYNFNRKLVKRLKSIRDKKRGRINNKKKHLGIEKNEEKPLNKKQLRKQKRLDRIMKELDQKDHLPSQSTNNVISKSKLKRRNKRGGKANKSGEGKMEIEE
jgi:hypothetical protein